jgi:hypothetical protein
MLLKRFEPYVRLLHKAKMIFRNWITRWCDGANGSSPYDVFNLKPLKYYIEGIKSSQKNVLGHLICSKKVRNIITSIRRSNLPLKP